MRVAGEAIARQAGIENGDLAAGTAELQGGGEAGKAAADDDDVIHGDGLRVVDGGGCRWVESRWIAVRERSRGIPPGGKDAIRQVGSLRRASQLERADHSRVDAQDDRFWIRSVFRKGC